MAVMLHWSSVAFLLAGVYGASAACPSFNINYPPMRTLLCPGDTITYTCAFATPNVGIISTQWSGSGFQCPSASNKITLSQVSTGPLTPQVMSCGNLSAVMTNVSGTCYTSVLTIPTPQYYNGTTVQCVDTSLTTVGNVTLNVQLASPPSAPIFTSLTSTYSSITVTWTSVPTATSYYVSINSSSSTPVTITSSGPLQNTFTGLTNNTVYTVSVVAINCAGNSSAATATNQTNQPFPSPSPSPSPAADSATIMVPSPSSSMAPASTNGPAQTFSSSATAVGIGVGVSLGIIVLLLAAAIAVVVVVIVVHRRGPPASPIHTDAKSKEEVNEIPLPPKNSSTVPKSEGMIYADIGLPKRLPLQAPVHTEETTVTYSTVQAARTT